MVDAADREKVEASRNELHNLLDKPQLQGIPVSVLPKLDLTMDWLFFLPDMQNYVWFCVSDYLLHFHIRVIALSHYMYCL